MRVFLDSSVFFSAIYSKSGTVRELIILAAQDQIELVISQDILKDAAIVAGALKARPDYFVTYDRKHLINPPEVSNKSGLRIVTPKQVIEFLV